MKPPALAPPPELPGAGRWIPTVAVPVVFIIAGVLLSLVDYGLSGWLAVGFALSAAGAWWARYLFGWVLIVFLAAGQLAHHSGLSLRFLVLLAGLHLLHVLAMLTLELHWRSWVRPAVFVAPLRRFLVIQVPTQLLAILALLLLAPGAHGHRPVTIGGFAVVGAVAVVGIALLLTEPHRTERRPRPAAGGAPPGSGG